MDPDWRQCSTMIRGAARAVRELAPDLRLVLGGISPSTRTSSSCRRNMEHLFRAGRAYLMATTPGQMRHHVRLLTRSRQKRQDLAGHALETIRRRHHCDLRAEQLEDICQTFAKTVG